MRMSEQTERRIELTNVVFVFQNFANVPKNISVEKRHILLVSYLPRLMDSVGVPL